MRYPAKYWSVPHMKTLMTIEMGKGSMAGVLRRCWFAIVCAAIATAASAQTDQVIYSFSDLKTGYEPQTNGNALVLPNGHLIGIAMFGADIEGRGNGVVFEEIPPTT